MINGKNFYDQPIDSDIKGYEEIRKLTTGQWHWWILYYWIFVRLWLYKNHYRLIAVDLCRQKELDADPKAIQQIEFVRQLEKLDDNDNAKDAGNDQSMFFPTILEKTKEARLTFSQGSVKVL